MVKARRPPMAETRTRRFYDLTGLALFFVGAACLLWLTLPQSGAVPSALDDLLRLLAGSGCYVIPVILMFIGTMFLVGYERMSFSHSTIGSFLLFLTFVTWRHLLLIAFLASTAAPGFDFVKQASEDARVMHAGGYVGWALGTVFHQLFGPAASYLFITMMACMAVVLLVDRPFIELLASLRTPAAAGLTAARQGAAVVKSQSETIRENRQARRVERADRSARLEDEKPPVRRGLLSRYRERQDEDEEPALPAPAEAVVHHEPHVPPASPQTAAPSSNGRSGGSSDRSAPAPRTTPDLAHAAATGAFQLPPMALLKEAPPAAPKKQQQELNDKIKVLEGTLDHFGIGANVVEIAHGPTVTRYEIQLAPGIKVSKIVSLADNLAMALAAIDVRVEAPIPGKSAIGIEVPNSTASVVTLRECLETNEFRSAVSKLTFALGKDVAGTFKYADLTRMPHLLIGGSTNSGKSICLNTLIASLLYRATPADVQFLMIDPKRVELSLWDGIPHLMHPVVKDVKQAAGIFRAALKEMDRRYTLFQQIGTRNIDGYNQRMIQEGKPDDKLAYIVIVVDELADLMMQAAAEIETSICRLAQLARATGIHLVIATQRPSVDVITGLIKANISSRVAFAVSSQVDSRTILDMNGAERLIGRGDMLFLPIDASKPVRIQGCYLTEQETNALVDYLKQQEKPNYTLTAVEVGGIGGGAGSGHDEEVDDEFYEAAVRLVVTNGQASTSMLQRRFKIGYTRAARLVDIMEQRGIVGPLDGAKPREILMNKDEIDQMFREELAD